MIAEPIIAIDRVLSQESNGLETEKYLSANELIFAGHYPHIPIYPGVFLLETILQSIAHWAKAQGKALTFIGIQTFRLFAPALPGDVIRCVCALREESAAGTITFQGVCSTSQGQTVAKAVVEFAPSGGD
jgi:3-hydroxyacyl-[acyl-carrier-protein] dehydratase